MKLRKIRLSALCLMLTLSFPSWICAQTVDSRERLMDEFIRNGMKEWRIPGMAVAVIKDNRVVYKKSFGVLNLETGEHVNNQSLFAMASTTKAMTTFGLALLVEDGKLSWDDHVVDHLPYFRLGDSYITADLRIRDLVSHRAGLGNADFFWVASPLSTEEIVKQMRFAENKYPFRSGYIYQNIMYAAAGEVIHQVSGMNWGEFMQRRIFIPLQMTRTTPFYSGALLAGNLATPHYMNQNEVIPIDYMVADQIGAAGSVNSTIDDVAKWVSFLLDSATIDGKQVISSANYAELFQPHTIIPKSSFYPTAALTHPHWMTYALGWFQHDYKGRMVNFHTGSLAGMVAICGLILEENVGVYVFANLDHAELRHAIMYMGFDLYAFGEEDGRNWHREVYDLYDSLRLELVKKKEGQANNREKGTSPSSSFSQYAGDYSNEMWGRINFSMPTDSSLALQFENGKTASLDHWHYDTFYTRSKYVWFNDVKIRFEMGETGNPESVVVGSINFRKEPSAETEGSQQQSP